MCAKELQIPDFESAQRFFAEYIEDLVIPFAMGWAGWSDRGQEELVTLSDRTRANIVYDFLKREVRRRFGEENLRGTRVIEEHGLVFVDFDGVALVRFKKVDGNQRSSNVSTRQQRALARQELELPDMPNDPTFVTAGYELNELRTEIRQVSLSCWLTEYRKAWTLVLADQETNQMLFDKCLWTPSEGESIEADGPVVTAKISPKREQENG